MLVSVTYISQMFRFKLCVSVCTGTLLYHRFLFLEVVFFSLYFSFLCVLMFSHIFHEFICEFQHFCPAIPFCNVVTFTLISVVLVALWSCLFLPDLYSFVYLFLFVVGSWDDVLFKDISLSFSSSYTVLFCFFPILTQLHICHCFTSFHAFTWLLK